MPQELGPLARELSESYYEDALPAHDIFHANRVRDLALRLATDCDQSVERDLLAAAAWLHDIGRPLERTGKIEHHDKWATAEAATLLEEEGVPATQIEAIQHCIRSHSIRSSSPEPETIEAKLLFDADKLEAAGARGIVRLACIVGERSGRATEKHAVIDNKTLVDIETSNHPDISLLRKWARERLDLLYTPPGRRLGESRWEYMDEFFTRFNNELGRDET